MAFPTLFTILFFLTFIPTTFSRTLQSPLSSSTLLLSSSISFSTHVHHRRRQRYINTQPSNTLSTFSSSKVISDTYATNERLLVIPVGIGRNSTSSPMLKTELIIDTGSSLTWVQAIPCDSCYEQGAFPYYNQFTSESFEAINCKDEICRDVPRASHNECLDLAWDLKEPCSYNTEYGDGTTSSGVIGTETFYFQDPYVGFGNEPVRLVPFGLGTSNHIPRWIKVSTPGIAGLMRGPGTLIDRLKVTKFSHCFPREEDATGILSFGEEAKIMGAKIALLNSSRYYMARLTNVYLAGKWIPMKNDVLPTKMMFDTGFTHSFLDPNIMDAVVEAIKGALGRYQPRKVKGFELCYDLTQLYSVSLDELAKITFEFNYTTDIHVFSFHLWERHSENQLMCLSLHRGAPKENIFGNNLMREVNIGYTLEEDDLAMYFHRQHCK